MTIFELGTVFALLIVSTRTSGNPPKGGWFVEP